MKELRRNPADAALVVGRHRKRGAGDPAGITEEKFLRTDAGATSSVSRLRRYFPLIRSSAGAHADSRGNPEPATQPTEFAVVQPLTQTTVAEEPPSEDRAERDERFGFVTTDISPVIAHLKNKFAYPLEREQEPIFVILEGENESRFRDLTSRGTKFNVDLKQNRAAYNNNYKIIFATPEAAQDPRALLHEGTHAVVDVIHPELLEAVNQFADALDAHINGAPVPQDVDAQRAEAAGVLHEGLAKVEELEGFASKDAAEKYRADFLHGHYRHDSPEAHPKWIEEQFTKLQAGTDLYERALAEPDPVKARHLCRLAYESQTKDQFISTPRYIIGFYLVDGILTELRKAGVAENEIPAWKQKIAESDPQSIEEFISPKAYLQKLQAATLTDL